LQEYCHLLLSNDRCQECLTDNLLTDQIIHILNIPQIQTLKELCDQLRKSTDTLSEDDGQYLKVQRLLESVEVPTNQQELVVICLVIHGIIGKPTI
jgi:hypothetical protein